MKRGKGEQPGGNDHDCQGRRMDIEQDTRALGDSITIPISVGYTASRNQNEWSDSVTISEFSKRVILHPEQ